MIEGGDDAPEAAELLRRAELAIEVSKSAGRGAPAAAYGRALETDGLSRLALEADLRGSIERGEIHASSSRSCGSPPANSAASRRWRAGATRAAASWPPTTSWG